MNPGDIIKIGRITLRIRDIYFSNNKNINQTILNESINSNIKEINILKTDGDPLTNANSSKKISNNMDSNVKEKIKPITLVKNLKKDSAKNIFTKIEKKNNLCRICYMEEESDDNPLLQPCICSGSMKFIHLSCLKHWISTRSCIKIDTTENCIVYIIKEVECELCKTKFPDYIKHEEKLYALLDFSNEFQNYLTLESLTIDKNKNKFIYVVSLKKRKMKMGRTHESDVLLSDISVSRVHSFLVVDNKKVYLEDNNSKFATLVLMQYSAIKIMEGIPLNFQVGRTYIDCRITKPFQLFNCCDIEERSNLYYYYNQNEKQIQKHMNLIVKKDYNELDNESNINYKNNFTFEDKHLLNIDEKYNFNSVEGNDKDKISDNEYFRVKRRKLNKNLTRALIDEDDENDKKKDGSSNEEENENDRKINRTENGDNDDNDKKINDGDEKSSSNKSQKEDKNNNQDETESICVSENNETLKKDNCSNLD